MADGSIDPPHSRLFVLCSKSTSYDDLKDAFEKYGTIDDIWIVKDKSTGEPKGVVYIKFAKTSAAALAAEEMHGKTLESSPKPLKVMVAHSREQGSKKDDDFERLVRLFIVIPKSTTEEELREHFDQYGKVDSINIVKNRDTGESKGFAYVKFLRPYHAAKAFEQCSKSYKAVFAKPREQKQTHNPHETSFDRYSGSGNLGSSNYVPHNDGMWGGGYDNRGGGDMPGGRLIALVPAVLREQHIYRLFDIIPGLQMCRPIHDSRHYNGGQQKILVQYSSGQSVQHALEKLNGFEYPPGHRISVKLSNEQSYHYQDSGQSPSPRQSGTTTISNSELSTLTNALAKAESIIKAAGLTGGIDMNNDSNYCSVSLPPSKPLASRSNMDSPAERLFIVCQPGLPPMYALRDVFGRFGDLIEVYVINGKNCGYVSYASKEAAEQAIETLHLQEVCGMRLKVMKAEPPRGGPHERKRIRMDTDDS